MLPKLIIHNSITLDGSFVNFEPNMELHYQIAGKYQAEAHLVGSNTAKIGFDMFGAPPPETKKDFEKPNKDKNLPYWVIPDTKGILKGLLHGCRNFEFCRDVIVLVSETTPKEYLDYLKERNYGYHVIGEEKVDLKKALKLLADKYQLKTILTDTGRILGNLLLDQELVNEISLLIHPIILGEKAANLFSNVKKDIKLKLIKNEVLENNYLWSGYQVIPQPQA